MQFNNLWTTLRPKTANVERIKDDLERGIAPDLPYFIVNMDQVKSSMQNELLKINNSFQYCLIEGMVGNGKTNLLKYLEYYFELNPNHNVHTACWRADINKYDLILFLLYIIQQNFNQTLLNSLKKVYEERQNFDNCCNEFSGSYAALREYVNVIIQNIGDDEKLQTLIMLGTGKIYDAHSFKTFSFTKLTDYNRREVLVFFLNVLAETNFYILFEIDELERIQEKSRNRFQAFLTSFRELIDLSSQIKGHMIVAAATDNIDNSNYKIESYNEAFYRRIRNNIYIIPPINKNEDINELAMQLNIVFGEIKNEEQIKMIAEKAYHETKKLVKTSDVVQFICQKLLEDESFKTWQEVLEENNLFKSFEDKRNELIDNDVMTRINQKFFASVKNYIEIITVDENDYIVLAQQFQTLVKNNSKKCNIFLFTSDVEPNIIRIKSVHERYSNYKLVIFTPQELSLSKSDFEKELSVSDDGKLDYKLDVIPYEPIDLMALLEMLSDDYENDNLREIISLYTKENM